RRRASDRSDRAARGASGDRVELSTERNAQAADGISIRMVRKLAAAIVFLVVRGSGVYALCTGDCDGDGRVGVHELIAAVDIALGRAGVEACPDADPDRDGTTALDELVASVRNSIDSCGAATPTPTRTPTPAATAEPVPTTESELLAWLEAG